MTRWTYRRVAASVALCLLGSLALAGCSFVWNATKFWLDRSQIITSSTVTVDGCPETFETRVTGVISPSATEAQVRRLAAAATAHRGEASAGTAEITLLYGKTYLDVERSQQASRAAVDMAVRTNADDRLVSASVTRGTWILRTSSSMVLAVYAGYRGAGQVDVYSAGDDTGRDKFMIRDDPENCTPAPALIAEFAALVANPNVGEAFLYLCSSLTVGITDPAAQDALVAELQPLASDPPLAHFDFRITQNGGDYFQVTARTPALAPFFDLLKRMPEVRNYQNNEESIGVLAMDEKTVRSVTLAVDAADKPAAVGIVRIYAGHVSVYANGDGTTAAQVALWDKLLALDSGLGLEIYPRTPVTLSVPRYDSAIARQLVDAVRASGLWRSHDIEFAVLSGSMRFTAVWSEGGTGFAPTEASNNAETRAAVEELRALWSAGQ
ncbi:hypothetical protein [Cryobacterium sp. GrIS_2_6]|uniref:hypothetical protein n=1 Tax=Cryobacterium sp. GrIS_2_6 TaxID=3162785 RepID=UPI002E0CF0EF|nr:hypothetical protein [Cryobacterium psychrotolerans]